jgi:hypothetical protein
MRRGRCQLRIREFLASEQLKQRVAKQDGVLPVVEAEGHFVKVGGQMFDAELVLGADDGALETTRRSLPCWWHIGLDPLMLPMINGLMGCFVVGNVSREYGRHE